VNGPHAALPPLEGSQRLFATIFLSMANFMVLLDMTVANVSVPHISGSLAVSPSQGTWIITSYAVAEACIVPLTGWLTARVGTVRLFITCITGFALASMLCAWSTSLAMLVTARILQGLCGGPIMPLSQTLLLSSYPPQKSTQALGVWAMTTLVAPVAGPLLGGWISDNLSWEWIFYINLPIGLVGAVLVWSVYHDRETPRVRVPVDYVGLGLLILWVGALQLLLDKGRELDWFGSPFIVGLGVTSAIAFVFFVIWESTERNPIVDLGIFRNRNFTSAVLASCVIFGLVFGYMVTLPLWLQTYNGYTAMWAGLTMAPMGVLAIVAAPIIGQLSGRIDPRLIATFGVCVFGTVLLFAARRTPDASFATLATPQLLLGLGMTSLFLPMTAISLGEIPPSRMAAAAGLQNFVRTLFGAFGTALSTSFWDNAIVRHHVILTESITRWDAPAQSALGTLESLGMAGTRGAAFVDRMIDQQAAVMALTDFAKIAAALALLMAPLIWLAHRPRRPVDMTSVH